MHLSIPEVQSTRNKQLPTLLCTICRDWQCGWVNTCIFSCLMIVTNKDVIVVRKQGNAYGSESQRKRHPPSRPVKVSVCHPSENAFLFLIFCRFFQSCCWICHPSSSASVLSFADLVFALSLFPTISFLPSLPLLGYPLVPDSTLSLTITIPPRNENSPFQKTHDMMSMSVWRLFLRSRVPAA